MSWTEQATSTRTTLEIDEARRKVLEAEKEASLPEITKDKEKAMVSDQVHFQPVKSPGIYEAEFGLKNGNLIFHFWPSGYHEEDRQGKQALPAFMGAFAPALKKVIGSVFSSSQGVEISEDRDMGAWFVKVPGMVERQFWRQIAIQACEDLHKELGGSPG